MAIEITKEGQVLIRAPFFLSEEEISAFVHKKEDWIIKHLIQTKQRYQEIEELPEVDRERICFLTARARMILPERVKHYASRMHVTYGKIGIRHQKTRWGSCSTKGNLSFNCMLMAMPPEIQDYVVVHELCHLKEMNHSAAFWSEVEKVLPDYRQRRKWLKENGNKVK